MNKKVNIIVKAIEAKKGENIKVFETNNDYSDYVIVCSSLNNKNAYAICENIEDELEKNGYSIKNIEGRDSREWVLIDCYDIIIHVFSFDGRERFKIEELF